MDTTRIVLIGAGNVGWHLGQALHGAGSAILSIYSRRLSRASELAILVDGEATADLQALPTEADLYLLAVPDDVVSLVSGQLRKVLREDRLLAHCSGANSLQAIDSYFQRRAVFYPLQSFSRGKALDFTGVPIFLSAAEQSDLQFLQQLGSSISTRVRSIDDDQRARLHIAAVFANNFTNQLLAIADDLLTEKDLSLRDLLPLLRETVQKVEHLAPREGQTGPARRGDTATLERHLQHLHDKPDYQELYRTLSQLINPDLNL